MAVEADRNVTNSINGRVLIIDDDHSMVDMLSQMLADEGYTLDTAYTGAEGLRLFKERLHDVILTDLQIGDMTGIDVLGTAKGIRPQTSVIIITGYASTETAMEAVKLGANDYLKKPVKMLDLIKSVRTQMSSVKLTVRVNELNEAVAEERDKLRRSVAELSLLKKLAERMMSAMSFVEGFEVIITHLIEEVEADVAAIYDLERGAVRMSATDQLNSGELEQIVDAINQRGSELIGKPIKCSAKDFIGLGEDVVSTDDSKLLSIIVVPLPIEKDPLGLLVAASRRNADFEERWLNFITKLSEDSSEFLSRIKRTIERQRHFTANIVEHTFDGIAVVDPVANEVLLNPVACNMLDLKQDEKVTMDEVKKRLDCDFEEVWKDAQKPEGERTELPVVNIDKEISQNGEKVFYRLNISILPETGREAGKYLIVIHDVTKVRLIEEMKNRLISNITHEVRTPTSVVKEFASLILDGVAGDLTDAQREYIQIMQSNIERLGRLVENLLTLSRTDTNGFTMELQPIELKPIIDTVVTSMRVKLKLKDMNIKVDQPPELPLIYADSDAVTQILTNLLDNAFKYSPEKTEVNISVMEKGNRIIIAVADQGYGIAPADQKTIFSRFHRLVDQNDPRFQEGVGLGLALVKDLVTSHGGDTWLESEVGKGSTFFFSLQIVKENEDLELLRDEL